MAALALAFAVVVIVVTPMILAAPNVLSTPSAVIVPLGCAGALAGGRWGRRVASAVSVAGLIMSGLWLWLASDGFGQGTPWWDDLVEAGVLTVLFLVALGFCCFRAGPDRPSSRGRHRVSWQVRWLWAALIDSSTLGRCSRRCGGSSVAAS